MNAAETYNQYWESGLHANPGMSETDFQQTFAPVIGQDRVLDYGCGMGYTYQRFLARAVKRYVGADVSDVAIEDARRKGLGALRISAGSGQIEAGDGEFDAAVCIEVLEHLFDPLQAARELRRVLKPGGTLVATVPNFGYHAWRLMSLLRAQVPSEPADPKTNRYNGPHIRYFSKNLFARLLQDAGFEDVRVDSFDDGTVWDVFRAAGPAARISFYAREHFPPFLHCRFLQRCWPGLFAYRLRAVGRK
jgi:SAM-dependent methyltransferase